MSFSHLRATLFFLLIIGVLCDFLPYERMNDASYIVIVISVLLLSLGYFLTRDFASPQVILCATWSISLFLTSLDVKFSGHISHFNEMLNFQTWLVILFSILSFFIGSTLAMYPIKTRYREQIGTLQLNWDHIKLNQIITISFLIAMSVYVFAIVKNGGLPAFSENVNDDRSTFIPGTLGVFLALFQLVILLTTMNAILYGIKKTYFQILLALVSIVCTLLTTQRIGAIESILMSVIIFVTLWPYTSKSLRQQRKKTLIIFGSIFISAFLWGFVLIGQTRGLDLLQLTDLDNLLLEQLYIYFGGPAPRNLQMVMEGGIYYGINESTNGALFFRPFLWFMGFRNEVSLNDTFRGPNNATALFQYYIDLGVTGIIIFPLFWGAICGFFYGRFRRAPTIRTGVIYAILASAIYFFPLSERFSEPSTFIKVVLFSIVISIVFKMNTKVKKGVVVK